VWTATGRWPGSWESRPSWRDLMPVLDAIQLAKSHGDLDGGFKMVADELEKVAARHGLVAFGDVGDRFDPTRHEALMEVPLEEEVTVTTVSQVIQPGYQLRDRVIRPARVAVANSEAGLSPRMGPGQWRRPPAH